MGGSSFTLIDFGAYRTVNHYLMHSLLFYVKAKLLHYMHVSSQKEVTTSRQGLQRLGLSSQAILRAIIFFIPHGPTIPLGLDDGRAP